MKTVAVGSTNQVKVSAAKKAFRAVWPNHHFEIDGVKVASGVADHPIGIDDSVRGAKNRAFAAIDALNADFGIGAEGGLFKVNGYWMECGWVAVVDQRGIYGLGVSSGLILPYKFASEVLDGDELNIVCERHLGVAELGSQNGFFGYATNNAVTRQSSLVEGIAMALARFVHPELYE